MRKFALSALNEDVLLLVMDANVVIPRRDRGLAWRSTLPRGARLSYWLDFNFGEVEVSEWSSWNNPQGGFGSDRTSAPAQSMRAQRRGGRRASNRRKVAKVDGGGNLFTAVLGVEGRVRPKMNPQVRSRRTKPGRRERIAASLGEQVWRNPSLLRDERERDLLEGVDLGGSRLAVEYVTQAEYAAILARESAPKRPPTPVAAWRPGDAVPNPAYGAPKQEWVEANRAYDWLRRFGCEAAGCTRGSSREYIGLKLCEEHYSAYAG